MECIVCLATKTHVCIYHNIKLQNCLTMTGFEPTTARDGLAVLPITPHGRQQYRLYLQCCIATLQLQN